MKNNDRVVIQKIGECVALLGGQSDILGTINSWKDTLENDEVVADLQLWIEATRSELELHPA